jgi:death-on-curing protein
MEPVFLELGEVLLIHQDQIERYGGTTGIKDINLLKSAVAMPRAGIAERYLHEDAFEMAAACMYHIARDQPFVGGNKRTGAVAALVFLSINDVETHIEEEELESVVRSVAEGKSAKADISRFFQDSANA